MWHQTCSWLGWDLVQKLEGCRRVRTAGGLVRWATPSGMGGHSLVLAREAEKRPSGAGVAMLLLLLLSCFSRVRLCATHRQQSTRLPRPWDSPGKNTGVGCHFLLQCIKVKGKSLSHVRLFATPWTAAYQAPLSMGFSSTGVGCHCLLQIKKP